MKTAAEIQALKVISGILLGHLAKARGISLEQTHQRLTAAFDNELPDKEFAASVVSCLDDIFVMAKGVETTR